MPLSFPLQLERQASSSSGSIFLPEPESGELSLRLSRFPVSGKEIIVDIYQRGSRFHLQITRFESSLRKRIQNQDSISPKVQKVRIDCGSCEKALPLLREIIARPPTYIENGLMDDPDGDHYFLFYTNSFECIARGTTNPYSRKSAEAWQRIINRSYGSDHVLSLHEVGMNQ